MAVTVKKKTRLSRKDWLARAMEVLSRQGSAKLTIDHLCEALGVTKGSFYAHFESRADFVTQFVDYWAEISTQAVVEAIDKLTEQTPEDRLLALMQLLHRKRFGRYDAAVRAWATQEPRVAEGVRKVDEQRYKYIRQIFYDLGFRGNDLDVRTRLFVVHHSSEQGMRLPKSGLDADEEIRLRHAFFTRR